MNFIRHRTGQASDAPPPGAQATQIRAVARGLVMIAGPLLRLLRVRADEFGVILDIRLLVAARARRELKASGQVAASQAIAHLAFVAAGFMFGSLAFAIRPDLFVGLAAVVVMFFVALQSLVDYCQALFDTTDLGLLGPTPVSERTVLAARLAHVALYVAMVAAAIGLPMLLLGTMAHGFYPLVPTLLFAVMVSAALALLLTMTLYLFVVHWARPERIREWVVLVQIGASVGAFGLIQLAPVYMTRGSKSGQLEWLLGDHVFQWVVPPFYFRGLYRVLDGNASVHSHTLAALAIVVPLALGWLALRLAKGSYFTALQGMQSVGGERLGLRPRRRIWSWLRRAAARSTEQRATFDLFRALAFRERNFRMRVFPSFGIAFVAGLAAVLRDDNVPLEALSCGLIYAAGFSVPTVLVQARYGDHWEAGWIFSATPTRHSTDLYVGHYRASLLCFVLPLVALGVLIGVCTLDTAVLASLLFAASATMVFAGGCAHCFGPYLPFREAPKPVGDVSFMFLYMAATIGLASLIAIHLVLREVPFGLLGASCVTIASSVWLDRGLRRRTLRQA